MPSPVFFAQRDIMENKKPFFKTIISGIYCFADTPALCKRLLEGGARIIQFRDKNADDKTFFKNAVEMVSLVRRFDGAVLIINDRVDIAVDVMADGVHIGQKDEDIHSVLARLPGDMIVGVSANTVKKAYEAEMAGASYIGAGSVFPTPTKPDATVIGIDALRKIVKSVKIPVVAIGGITLKNIRQVVEAGAQCIAMISEINNAEDIPSRLRALSKILKQGG